ncbi:MAG: helix-turn-helix domain-containing protein [Oscillospiraceae bacterium]|nr:helix-turn-helix domain-containing protein [Oscillospiraceae bacterium]
MVDTQLLRRKIEDRRTTVSEIAAKMGVDKATLYRRIANSETFTIGEVGKITKILNLTHDEAVSIFFNHYVA